MDLRTDEVLSIYSDFTTGQYMYRIDLAKDVSESKTQQPVMSPFPQMNIPYWKPILTVWLPEEEFNNRYQVGQKYDFTISYR
jgi:hypothetical protein